MNIHIGCILSLIILFKSMRLIDPKMNLSKPSLVQHFIRVFSGKLSKTVLKQTYCSVMVCLMFTSANLEAAGLNTLTFKDDTAAGGCLGVRFGIFSATCGIFVICFDRFPL